MAEPSEDQKPGTTDPGPGQNEPVPRSHTGWGVTDQRTDEDHLDFETYVSVLKEFLTHERTKPPLTVSIEGKWGTGKSSFMAMLRKSIEQESPTDPVENGTRYYTVEFNPWRHEREEALWAAFMLKFFNQIRGRLRLGQRWPGDVRLVRRRMQWRKGWRDMVRLGLVIPLILLAVLFPSVALAGIGGDGIGSALLIGLGLGEVAAVAGIGVWAWQNVADPIENELQAYIADPDYENRVSFIERFHDEFGDILDSYVGDEARVFVFIDDLDRCPPSKAAELIQSINLMISSGDSRVFFVLGMDREKVAAGLAAKHEGLLDYLRASESRNVVPEAIRDVGDKPAGENSGGTNGQGSGATPEDRPSTNHGAHPTETYGLEFADNYLEKFVQIPFRIPKPREEGIRELVREMVRDDGSPGTKTTGVKPEGRPGQDREPEEDVLPEQELVQMAEMVAPVFDYNPRTVKMFVNLFRLRTMLASELGLFRDEEVTKEQLAKFVAIGLEWPTLTESLRDPDHAGELTAWALANRQTPPNGVADPPPRVPGVDRLSNAERSRLVDLLAAGVDDSEGAYRLGEIPEELFWISSHSDTSARQVDESPQAP